MSHLVFLTAGMMGVCYHAWLRFGILAVDVLALGWGPKLARAWLVM